MTTYQDRLRAINACEPALAWCATVPTFTEAWETCPDARWLLWLAFRVLPRRRAVGVLVEVVRATRAHLAPDEVTTDVLNPLAAWAAGDDSVDVVKVRERAWDLRCSTTLAAALAATAVAAATADAAAALASTAVAAALASTADAAALASTADAAAAMADVVRAHLGAAEVEAALMGGG